MRPRLFPSNRTTDGIGEPQLSAAQRAEIDRLRTERGWGIRFAGPSGTARKDGRPRLARAFDWLRGR